MKWVHVILIGGGKFLMGSGGTRVFGFGKIDLVGSCEGVGVIDLDIGFLLEIFQGLQLLAWSLLGVVVGRL